MNRTQDNHDTTAAREGLAETAYRENFSRTLDFGRRQHKTIYCPADIVHHRKRTRTRNGKQINLKTKAIDNRLENPELYRDIRKSKQSKTENTKMTMVTRKINGKETKLTPTENFIHTSGYRVKMIREQLKQLAKQRGTNFEYTAEHVDAIHNELLKLSAKYLGSLKAPQTTTTDGYNFAEKLAKV